MRKEAHENIVLSRGAERREVGRKKREVCRKLQRLVIPGSVGKVK
jgi:hypothetical protein